MVSDITRFVVVFCVACQLAYAEPQSKPRMTKQEVIAVASRAIEGRFPWAAAKHYHYDAFLQADGIWGVYVPRPDQPGLRGGGDPNAEVRDHDGKVLKVYLAR